MKRRHPLVDDPSFTHGLCGFDRNGPVCQEPATWHYIVMFRGRPRECYACDDHHRDALPHSIDHHRAEPPCPRPASQWVPRTPGASFCQDPEETAAHHEQITRPALQPA